MLERVGTGARVERLCPFHGAELNLTIHHSDKLLRLEGCQVNVMWSALYNFSGLERGRARRVRTLQSAPTIFANAIAMERRKMHFLRGGGGDIRVSSSYQRTKGILQTD